MVRKSNSRTKKRFQRKKKIYTNKKKCGGVLVKYKYSETEEQAHDIIKNEDLMNNLDSKSEYSDDARIINLLLNNYISDYSEENYNREHDIDMIMNYASKRLKSDDEFYVNTVIKYPETQAYFDKILKRRVLLKDRIIKKRPELKSILEEFVVENENSIEEKVFLQEPILHKIRDYTSDSYGNIRTSYDIHKKLGRDCLNSNGIMIADYKGFKPPVEGNPHKLNILWVYISNNSNKTSYVQCWKKKYPQYLDYINAYHDIKKYLSEKVISLSNLFKNDYTFYIRNVSEELFSGLFLEYSKKYGSMIFTYAFLDYCIDNKLNPDGLLLFLNRIDYSSPICIWRPVSTRFIYIEYINQIEKFITIKRWSNNKIKWIIENLPTVYSNDKKIHIAAMKQNSQIYHKLSSELKKDKDIVKLFIQQN